MDWLKAKQQTIPLNNVDTVADLIAILKKLPREYKLRNADEGTFCEINIATDGKENMVSLY